MGFHCRPATGTTPRMARLLARHSGFCSEDGPALMKATRALPVTATDWPTSVKQRLNQMGLHTLGDLLNCCSNELASRLGPELQEDLQRILGKRADPWMNSTRLIVSINTRNCPRKHATRTGCVSPGAPVQGPGTFPEGNTNTPVAWIRVTLHHPDRPATPLELRTARQEYQAEAFLELALLHLNAIKLEDDARH